MSVKTLHYKQQQKVLMHLTEAFNSCTALTLSNEGFKKSQKKIELALKSFLTQIGELNV